VYPDYQITLSTPTGTYCAGDEVSLTATVNNVIYQNDYVLSWTVGTNTDPVSVSANVASSTYTLTLPTNLCSGVQTVEVTYTNNDNTCQTSVPRQHFGRVFQNGHYPPTVPRRLTV
jgi:hypothetical protein